MVVKDGVGHVVKRDVAPGPAVVTVTVVVDAIVVGDGAWVTIVVETAPLGHVRVPVTVTVVGVQVGALGGFVAQLDGDSGGDVVVTRQLQALLSRDILSRPDPQLSMYAGSVGDAVAATEFVRNEEQKPDADVTTSFARRARRQLSPAQALGRRALAAAVGR